MARPNIAESLLEMHYFRTLVRRYKRILGAPHIQIFKPTTSAEKWYGFDQGYFRANIAKPQVIDDLRDYLHSGRAPTFTSFRAFFLQFKVVEPVTKRSKLSPTGWIAPYYRSELTLEANKDTGLSQHETLRRLSQLNGASVSYVCPMIFDENDTLAPPRSKDLRFVDVASSPNGWLTNQRHFVAFQTPNDPPFWCSDPIPAQELTWKEVIENAPPLDAKGVLTLIDDVRKLILGRRGDSWEYPNFMPACLSIVAEY